jgi:hypothetical protein
MLFTLNIVLYLDELGIYEERFVNLSDRICDGDIACA